MLKEKILFGVMAGLAGGWTLLVGGRKNTKGIGELDRYLYAHRGFHRDPDAPENSLEAFRRAADRGFGAELDVHLTADGNLAVVHDSQLKRMTGKKGIVEKLRLEELENYRLGRSGEKIPTLRQVLDIFEDRTPLIVELKTSGDNHEALCGRVWEELKDYRGLYCIESFHPMVVLWFKKNHPEVIRGQLSQNFLKDRSDLSLATAAVGTFMLYNFLSRPDFIAYRFAERGCISNQLCRKVWKMRGAAWTIRTPAALRQAKEEGYWPIFDSFDPETGEMFTVS